MNLKSKTITKILVLLGFFVFFLKKQVLAACNMPYCIGKACSDLACNTCAGCQGSYGKIVNPSLPDWLNNLSGTDFLQRILVTGISLGFFVGSLVFFFMFIIGGIKWITSGGDKTHLESAQKQLTHALIGLAILFSIFAIIQLIEYIFGVSLLNLTLPTL